MDPDLLKVRASQLDGKIVYTIDGAWYTDTGEWIHPVAHPTWCQVRAPVRCPPPAFITPAWRSKMHIDSLRCDRFRHSELGDVYTVSDKSVDDAPTEWYDKCGHRIHTSSSTKQEDIWLRAVRWVEMCG